MYAAPITWFGEVTAPDLEADPESVGQALAEELARGGAREILTALAHE